jgi:hypothetical protein
VILFQEYLSLIPFLPSLFISNSTALDSSVETKKKDEKSQCLLMRMVAVKKKKKRLSFAQMALRLQT